MKLRKIAYYFIFVFYISLLCGCMKSGSASENNVTPLKTSSEESQDFHTLQILPANDSSLQLVSTTQETNPYSPVAPKKVPILMFHYISQTDRNKNPMGYNLSTDPKLFEEILQYLSKKKYRTIHVEDLLGNAIPERSIILTFDDGHEDFYTTAWPLLKKYHFTASEGIITSKMGVQQYLTSQQVKELSQNGIEILSHSLTHPDLSKDLHQEDEIKKSKTILEQLVEKPVIGFVYPSGKYNEATIKFLQEAGYQIALTTKGGLADPAENLFELPRIRIDNRVSIEALEKKLAKENPPSPSLPAPPR